VVILSIIIFIIGFSSIFTQSLFVRELVVVFYGNEISIGVILCSWFFWTGVGSFIFGRLSSRIKATVSVLSLVQLIFSLVIILEIFWIRNLRILLQLEPGEIIGPLPIFYVSLFILAPFAFINGFLFSLSVKLFSTRLGLKSIGFVYSLDALGDMWGGIIFSFLFVFLFGPLNNLYLIASLNLICVLTLIFLYKIRTKLKILVYLAVSIFLILGFNINYFENYLLKREWRGFNLVDTKSSLYGYLYLTRYQDNFSLFENGILSFTFPLRVDSEETVHFPLLESGGFKRILVIGEGARGLLYEILKYPVEEVYYLELDPALINFVKEYLPSKDRKVLFNPKVKIFNLEARVFLNQYRGKKFDAILLNTCPPYTAYLNRFYTYELFKKINQILTSQGIFSFTLPSKENYLTKELRNFNASIYHTLKRVFPNILLIPGDKLRFIASPSGDFLTYDAKTLSQRLEKYKIKTEFINTFYFQSKLLPWQIDYVNNTLKEYKEVRLNYDFLPITYYYGVGFFSSHFRSPVRKFFDFLSGINPFVYCLIFSFIWLAFYIIKRGYILALSVFSMGASGMAAVVFSILGFQIVYGYVYHKIGLISASFMFGLACGSNFVNKRIDKVKLQSLLYLYILGGLYILSVPYIFKLLTKTQINLAWVSFFLPFFMGGIVGWGFPLANKLYLKGKGELVKNVGVLYACDLLGGAFSGLFLSLVFIPLYGLFVSGGIISFMVFLSCGFLFIYLKSRR